MAGLIIVFVLNSSKIEVVYFYKDFYCQLTDLNIQPSLTYYSLKSFLNLHTFNCDQLKPFGQVKTKMKISHPYVFFILKTFFSVSSNSAQQLF